ncbi:MAG: DUF1929 domain-containing protein [Solirubrobacterales bacterium]|nr:DUF1929 domain-containing protein [Solirubrobacterales bacterium]
MVSAGDDTNGGYNTDTAEIYSPPYLFKGIRPKIEAAPASVGYGQSLTVDSSASDVAKAVLIAPGATTHANDMSQRHVPLTITGRSGGELTLKAPANADIAPPSRYMLFLVDGNGVPSVARFIKLGGGPVEPPPPPATAPRLTATPGAAAFGTVDIAGTKELSVTVENAGDADATVSTPSLSGADAGQFSAPAGGFTLAPGARRDLTVTFAPTTAGAKAATMSLSYGAAAGSPLTVALSGTGNDPVGPPPPPSGTRTVTLQAEADTMVKQASPTSAFGSVNPLLNDRQDLATASSAIQTYLRFTVPALADGETITAANLGLAVTDATTDGPSIWRTAATWSEATLTWNTRPSRTSTTPAGNFTAMTATSRATTPVTGVTAAGPVSLQLYPDSTDGLAFASREDTNRPQLTLTIRTP